MQAHAHARPGHSAVPTAAMKQHKCNLDPEAIAARANATTFARHDTLVDKLTNSVGRPRSHTNVLVLNAIDKHYTTLIRAWSKMIDRASFRKRIFVVAMDEEAAAATEAGG